MSNSVNSTSYFYNRSGRHNITFAYQRNSDGSVKFGAAFCRASDPFVKSRGREIALGRMAKSDAYGTLIPDAPAERWRLHEMIMDIVASNKETIVYVPKHF
jgi:hypothetical protein